MQITKKIIAPLLIMILLAGAAGIMSAQEIMHHRMQSMDKAGDTKQIAPEVNQDQSQNIGPTDSDETTDNTSTRQLLEPSRDLQPDTAVSSPAN